MRRFLACMMADSDEPDKELVLQESGGCSASLQALHERGHRELEKLVTVLPERLAATVLEQPDFPEVCCPSAHTGACPTAHPDCLIRVVPISMAQCTALLHKL